MKALRNHYSALVILAMTLLVACAQLGVPTPDTVNQKIAVAVVTVTSIRTTATTLLTAQKISVEDAENIQKQADTAREGLNVARTIKDPLSADNKVEAVTTVLRALQAYLLTKQGK